MKRRTVLVALALGGCARSPSAATQSPRVGPLPPPTYVVVTDFTLPRTGFNSLPASGRASRGRASRRRRAPRRRP